MHNDEIEKSLSRIFLSKYFRMVSEALISGFFIISIYNLDNHYGRIKVFNGTYIIRHISFLLNIASLSLSSRRSLL